jgi:glycosyltransferase involved in cell wall biosynthesis
VLGLTGSIADNQAMQGRLVERTDRMVVLNDTARRMLVANGAPAAKIVLNRLGVSHDALVAKPLRPTRSPVRFGFVGRLHRTKGIEQLAHAVRSIPRDVAFTLEIRGPEPDPSERPLVDAMRSMLSGDPRVTFGGPMPHADVPHALASFDVLCCPSIWFENGPTIALEAIAVGTPVIGTSLGNLAELIHDGVSGRLVAAGKAEELAAALVEIASHPLIVDRWRAALPRVRTMDQIACDYVTLYQELLRERAVA